MLEINVTDDAIRIHAPEAYSVYVNGKRIVASDVEKEWMPFVRADCNILAGAMVSINRATGLVSLHSDTGRWIGWAATDIWANEKTEVCWRIGHVRRAADEDTP